MLLHGGQTANLEEYPESSSSHQIGRALPTATNSKGPGWLQSNPGQNGWGVGGRALSALNRFGQSARMESTPVWMQRVEQQQAILRPPSESST